jgi:anion-transporting  ArsA/GET3 family ATPase
MLDAGATFDRLVREQSGSESQADRVIRNRVYQAISKSLAGVQDYMAIERLHELASSGDWDLVIVDTPPSRNAIDLLRAPDRLVSFLGHPIYRTLTAGQRTFAKLTDAASSVFLWAVRRLAGPQIVDDVVEFFRSIAGIESGLRRRAKEVAALLRAPSTAFVVVSSPRAEAIDESLHVIEALGAGRFPLGGVIANLVHPMPEPLTGLSDEESADLDALEPGPLADHVAWHAELSALASDERRQLSMLSAATGDVPIVELALLDVDVHDLASLAVLADRLADAT